MIEFLDRDKYVLYKPLTLQTREYLKAYPTQKINGSNWMRMEKTGEKNDGVLQDDACMSVTV